MPVRLTGYLQVPEARLGEVARALDDHICQSRAEPGCLSFELRLDEACPTRLLVNEAFVDHAAFDAHQARTRTSAWAAITKGIIRHYQISETP